MLDIVAVGLPFGAFKILTGMVLRAFAGWGPLGWALIALGSLDLLLNAIALVFTAFRRSSPLPLCLAQWVTTWLGAGRPAWRQLGLSIDAMLAFTLVAAMIGLGWLPRLPAAALGFWSLGVVLNVLGAGLGRLAESVLDLDVIRR